MKNYLASLIGLTCLALLSGCGGGMTLKEVSELSSTERMTLERLSLTGIEGEGELDLDELLQGFKSLRELEIDSDFKGTLDGSSDLAQMCRNLAVVKAPGVKKIDSGTFYNSHCLQTLDFRNVEEIDRFAFENANVAVCDFPKASIIGYQAFQSNYIPVIKLGSDERISCYGGFINTENIDLYLGDYEYENNVNGNVWTTYAKAQNPVIDMNAYARTGKPVIITEAGEWYKTGEYTFKSINRY